MDWNITWFFTGGIAFLLAIINLIRFFAGQNKGWQTLMFASLSFGAITVLEECRMINQWMEYGESVALQSVPQLTRTLTIAVYLGIALNFIILVLNSRKAKKTIKE